MKKNKKVSKRGKPLKKLKEESENYFCEEKYDEALIVNEKIIKIYPKNIYGYLGVIKAKTHNYTIYLEEDKLKELKTFYETSYELASKNEKNIIEKDYEEYIDDCREVENLKKIRKEITGKELLNNIYNDAIIYINQNISVARQYGDNGKKLKNGYDLVKGLFFLVCLIYNLIYRNYLLLLTIPLGVFGLIIIYSFIDMNFFKKGTIRKEKEDFQDSIKEALEKVIDIKKDIKKIEDNIAFLNEQKYSTISKVPESFFNQIEDLIVSNEKVIATEIFNDLLNNNVPGFMLKVNDYTSLNPEDITNNIKTNLKDENSKISEFINAKTTEKKNKQNEVMYMKKVSNFSLTIIAIEIFVSVLSIIVLIRNFSNINKEAFIVAMIAGVISTLSYNIDTGRHNSIRETTSDNLFSSIFNASLVYDLIYLSYMSKLEFAYGFIEMPIIFILLFIGFTSVISLLKYNNLMKKLRG